MLRTLSRPLVAGVEKYLPGAFVFAVALTLIVAVLALLVGDVGPVGLTPAWGDGLAGLSGFRSTCTTTTRSGPARPHDTGGAGGGGARRHARARSRPAGLSRGLLRPRGFDLTLDIVDWSFLAAILLLVRSPQELTDLIGGAVRTVGEVLLQYPLYAGIIGMMTASGLAERLSEFFTDVATPGTLGVLAFLSARLLKLFVPSGGGQFAVQAPILLNAAGSLDVDPAVITMAIAYGDQWTNMIQPFWALPLLTVAGPGVRDIFGFTAITCLVTGIVLAPPCWSSAPGSRHGTSSSRACCRSDRAGSVTSRMPAATAAAPRTRPPDSGSSNTTTP